jgi:pimeloyl-ACP methyl ester carboxylesterase
MNNEREKIVKAGDIKISYEEFGNGYPLILIMGYSGEKEFWPDLLINELSKLYRVIIFDNRGIGGSTSTEKEYSIELFAEDTKSFLDALGIKKANVLGWSMGTYVLQELMLKYPDKINKLIILSGNCRGKESVEPSQNVIDTLTDTSGTVQEIGERFIKLLFPSEFLKSHSDMSWIYSNIKRKPQIKNIQKQGKALGKWKGDCDRLQNIKKPVLLITGCEDIVIPPQNSFAICNKIPGTWLVQFKGAGHGLMFQYPKKLSDTIKLFLED